jgi:glutaredoxin-like protein
MLDAINPHAMSASAPKEGSRVPDVTFKARRQGQWVDVSTHDLFSGKRVVVFCLPGAYTPTCSASHLPRYNELVPTFKANGIDDVVCMSVNDGFVMSEWAASQEADRITMVPDGNGEFAQAMGMLVDKRELGFGMRSRRYAMLVQDGVIEKMFMEPDKEGDPFEVSDADTMLRYLAPQAPVPPSVMMFTKPGCPYCAQAKVMLQEADMAFEEVSLGHGITTCTLQAVAGAGTTPQIFVGGQKIGGAQELRLWLRAAGHPASELPA